jgi:hypothetical protein
MLQTVEVRTAAGDLLSLPLQNVLSGYSITNIEGLDPVKATLVSSSFANMDGEQFHSARRETRNIVLTIGLEPDYLYDSIETLRRGLYGFFMPKGVANMRFIMDDGLEADIQGVVESFETPLFSKDPEVTISMVCYDPDFVEADPVVLAGNTTALTTETTINYYGTVDTGVLLQLNVNRSLSGFTVYHRDPSGTLRSLDFQAAMINGDIVKISTMVGNKYARKTTGGTETSALYAVSPQSYWLKLQPGTNAIRVYATGAAIPYTLTYVNRYGGL